MHNHLEMVQGDDYLSADGRAIAFAGTGLGWPANIINVKLILSCFVPACSGSTTALAIEIDGMYSPQTESTQTMASFDVPRSATLLLKAGVRAYSLEVKALLSSGSVARLYAGVLTVLPGSF